MSSHTAANAPEITPEMLEAGEEAILCEVGGADLGGLFSARDLAKEVFIAMWRAQQSNTPAQADAA